jgi:hypothetical protein
MAKKYEHSAYYYAYHYGWTHSDARTFAGQYLDMHTYRPRLRLRPGEEWSYEKWEKWRNSPKELDSTFNPLVLLVLAAADIGFAMRDTVAKFADPVERDRMKRELMRDLRRIRRPFYYEQEVEHRRKLAIARRAIKRRRTTAPMPTPEDILKAWNERKTSREAMIRLGGMLEDLECYVDSCLKFDDFGFVAGRNGGIRGWLKEYLPELSAKYKTLMRYKALAKRVRQVAEAKDPTPVSQVLEEKKHKVIQAILADEKPVFSQVFEMLENILSPERVFLDPPKKRTRKKRKRK